MKVLLLGSGGREHALAASLAASPGCRELITAPGNPGTAALGRNVALAIDDPGAVLDLARREEVGLVVVGPEVPLVAGVVDHLVGAGVPAFGPTAAAARLEGSKSFAKEICLTHGVPTAEGASFADPQAAKAHLRRHPLPVVVKADGLMAGKGVVVAQTLAEAEAAVDALLTGEPGATVLVERFLAGEEMSFFALCDGTRALPFGTAQDHKRVGEGDTGPNTGGMGAVSPSPQADPALEARVMAEIVEPILRAMAGRGTPFRGFLFAGLMIGSDGPAVIEFNVRLGDPEAQAILPRLADDLLPLLLAGANGALPDGPVRFSPETALTVVMAARGYPGAPETGSTIAGLDRVEALPATRVFLAGTRRDDGTLVASGGRVLAVTALGVSARDAQEQAYRGVDAIDWPDGFCRRDIGWRAVAREREAG